MRTGITRWNPASDLMRDRFGRIFEDAFNDMLRPYGGGEAQEMSGRNWVPPVDIRETDEALTLLVDLPGLRKEDVNLTLENGILTITGERRFETEKKNDNYHRIERSYGTFLRSFSLPASFQAEKVEATFKDGVLQVVLPKQEESKPRRIDIR